MGPACLYQRPAWSWEQEDSVMKAWSVIGLLLAAVIAAMPISPRVTPLGVELGANQAQAATYRHYRRVYGRGYYGYYRSQQPIGGGGGQRYPW
jgi:hypothetical protein